MMSAWVSAALRKQASQVTVLTAHKRPKDMTHTAARQFALICGLLVLSTSLPASAAEPTPHAQYPAQRTLLLHRHNGDRTTDPLPAGRRRARDVSEDHPRAG